MPKATYIVQCWVLPTGNTGSIFPVIKGDRISSRLVLHVYAGYRWVDTIDMNM